MRNLKSVLLLLGFCVGLVFRAESRSITIDSVRTTINNLICQGQGQTASDSFKVYFYYSGFAVGDVISVEAGLVGSTSYTLISKGTETTPTVNHLNGPSAYISAIITTPGTYNIVVKSTAGGTITDTIERVLVRPPVGTPVFISGPSIARCQGSGSTQFLLNNPGALSATSITYSLVNTAPGYSLTPNNVDTSATITWNSIFSGNTILRVTATGCGAQQVKDTVIVTNPAPHVTASASLTSICSGDEATINFSVINGNGDQFTWTPTTQTNVIDALTEQNFQQVSSLKDSLTNTTNDTDGVVIYTVTAKNSQTQCISLASGTDTVQVTVKPKPVVTSLAPTSPICSGVPLTINLSASTGDKGNGTDAFTWIVQPTNVDSASAQSSPYTQSNFTDIIFTKTHTASGSVDYVITPTSAAGCVGVNKTFSVTVKPDPVLLNAASSTTICSGSPFTLPLTSSTGTSSSLFKYTSLTSTGVTNGSQQPNYGPPVTINDILKTSDHTNQGSIVYTIDIKSDLGCSSLAPAKDTVYVNPDPVVYFTNAPTAVCTDTRLTVKLSASTLGTDSFKWVATGSGVSGASSQSTFTNTDSISYIMTTLSSTAQGSVNFKVTAKSDAGCVALQDDDTTILVNPGPHLTQMIDSVCSGNSLSSYFASNAYPNGKYSWALVGTTSNYPNLIISGNYSGVDSGNSVRITDNFTSDSSKYSTIVKYTVITINTGAGSNGCKSTDTFRVKVNPRPIISNSNPPQICSGTPIFIPLQSSVLDANNVVYNWTYGGTSVSNNNAQTSCVGCSNIAQTLDATTTSPGTATYTVNASYFGCASSSSKSLAVTVNPLPVINHTASTSKCIYDSLIVGLSANIASNYSWVRQRSGNNSAIASGNDTGSTIKNAFSNLVNFAASQFTYIVTPKSQAAGCNGVPDTFTVTVNPKPLFTYTNLSICSGDSIHIDLKSATSTSSMGSGSSWEYTYMHSDSAIGGRALTTALTDSFIHQKLTNSSYRRQDTATYGIIAHSQYGCISDTTPLTVYIKPLPILINIPNPDTAICSGTAFSYKLHSSTGSSTSYSWTSNGAAYGASSNQNIQNVGVQMQGGTLNTQGDLTPKSVVYNIRLVSNGCSSDSVDTTKTQLAVTINPTPSPVAVSSYSAHICTGADSLNFSASRFPDSKEWFTWHSTNGTSYQNDSTKPTRNALISFRGAPAAVWITSSAINFSECKSNPVLQQLSVTIGDSLYKPRVTMFNGALVCLSGSNGNITAYQWGFDTISNLGATLIPNATSQSWFPTSPYSLDLAKNAYWVKATIDGDCEYKAYYNKIPGLVSLGVGTSVSVPDEQLSMQVYPNPTTGALNVALEQFPPNCVLEVIDLTGRQLLKEKTVGSLNTIDVSRLPSGTYFLNCYTKDGRRIANARFLKN